MDFSKGSDMWMMFSDYWKFCQKNCNPQTDADWLRIIEVEATELIKKYNNSQFIIDLIYCFINELGKGSS